MHVMKQFGTNWFTTVMGVGIVAALTFTSPLTFALAHPVGEVLFALVNVVFALALILWIGRWVLHTREALDDFRHPGRVLFYGALAMAINVVGNDYLLIGVHLIPAATAILLSQIIWVVGTVVSVFTVIAVPYLLFVEHEVASTDTLATWLIPVVPPIVAAATGINLIPFWGGAAAQYAMTAVCIGMFGMTFFLFLMVSAMVYSRLVFHRRLSGEAAPSLWVEIGPIGMSMATLATLPLKTTAILGAYEPALHVVGLLFAMIMWGVGVWWIVISSLHTLLHLGRSGEGLPFHLGWWSYVFPIGSFTTGTYALAHLTTFSFFPIASAIQLAMVWAFFLVVFARTAHGTWTGRLIAWRRIHRVETARSTAPVTGLASTGD